MLPVLDQHRVVVRPQTDEDFPHVEAGWIALQVPLADHCGLVAGLLQHLGKRRLTAVETVAVAKKPVEMAVLAGQHHSAARAADRVRAETIAEEHSPRGDAVEIRRPVDPRSVAAHRVSRVVVGKNEENIGPPFAVASGTARTVEAAQHGHGNRQRHSVWEAISVRTHPSLAPRTAF
jgi:hypothetical protein